MILSRRDKGVSIPEVLFSFAIGTLLVGIVLSMWYFAYRNWTIERIGTKLRINLQIAMERIKEEVRLSSSTYISLYKPAGETAYKAISFPQAIRDGNGFFPLDGDGNILWEKSAIYHVYENPPGSGNLELRRTEFTNNNSILKDTDQRELQLASVVVDGDGSQAPNSGNASTQVIFKNLVDLTILPKSAEFDGYSPVLKRSNNVNFGSIKLDPGDHSFRFEVTDKNAASVGYALGIDTISISPSGCQREGENLIIQTSSGDGSSVETAIGWSGNRYLEYNANEVGDQVTFRLYYDLWGEYNFDYSMRDNVVLAGDDIHAELADTDAGGTICWQAGAQTGSATNDYPDPVFTNVAIRNILSKDFVDIDLNQKLIRIKFVARTGNDLTINSAWIVERSTGEPEDGIGTPAQILFGSLPAVTITNGGETWSDWLEFSIDPTKDYFVTFHTYAANLKYCAGQVGTINSYYSSDADDDGDSDIYEASLNNWEVYTASNSIYGTEGAEEWSNQGTVTSTIYDTKIDGVSIPDYDTITWTEYKPSGTDMLVEVRASDNSDMSSSTSWTSVTNGGSIPGSLDGKRYIQFRSILTSSSPYTGFPWIDNVTIDWPGVSKMCDISGYFTQKPDYGIIKLLIDGEELTKGFEFSVTVYEIFRGETYEASLVSEIEPRNTRR